MKSKLTVFLFLLGIFGMSQVAFAKPGSGSAVKSKQYDQSELSNQLRTYLESDAPTTRSVELTKIIARVVVIQEQLDPLIQENKVEEAQVCLSELKEELKKIYEIKKADAEEWKNVQISNGGSQEVVELVVEQVLQEYKDRWSLS